VSEPPHVLVVGNVNVDMIMGPLEPWPPAGTEVVMPEYELRAGGSAGNAALALAALGVPFRLLANAGDDVLGRWLRDSFGYAAQHWRQTERPTTVSVGVTHPNGERTFLTNEGHLKELGPDDVLPHVSTIAPTGSIALLCGAFLSPPLVAAFGEILTVLKAAGYRVALDTGWPPAGWTHAVRSSLAEWIPAIDVLLLNEAEALALARNQELDRAVSIIREMLPVDSTLVVKRGADGASAWRREETAAYSARAIVVADSIGAGDVFNAAFLAAEIRKEPLRDAVAAGVKFASAVIATHPRRYEIGFELG
jgi:sugar/nucleoside kinase (ribokinase family)